MLAGQTIALLNAWLAFTPTFATHQLAHELAHELNSASVIRDDDPRLQRAWEAIDALAAAPAPRGRRRAQAKLDKRTREVRAAVRGTP